MFNPWDRQWFVEPVQLIIFYGRQRSFRCAYILIQLGFLSMHFNDLLLYRSLLFSSYVLLRRNHVIMRVLLRIVRTNYGLTNLNALKFFLNFQFLFYIFFYFNFNFMFFLSKGEYDDFFLSLLSLFFLSSFQHLNS